MDQNGQYSENTDAAIQVNVIVKISYY